MSKCNGSGNNIFALKGNKFLYTGDNFGRNIGAYQEFNKYITNEEKPLLLLIDSVNQKFHDEKASLRKRSIESNEYESITNKGLKTKRIHEHEISSINNSDKKDHFDVTPDTLLGCYANLTKLGVRIDDYFLIISKINSNKRSQDKSDSTINENKTPERENNRPKLYWAKHIATGFPVVIKVVKKTRIMSSFPGSYSIWKKLCLKLLNLPYHPNVMRIYQVLEDEENFYLVMEGLEGGELFQFLITEQAIPEETCKYIIRQILESVNHLHCLKMLHRDVKPENIMFRYKRREEKPYSPMSTSSFSTFEGTDDKFGPERKSKKEENITHLSLKTSREYFEVVLVDFDTCELIDDKPHVQMIRMKKRLVGTFGYLAPEVLNGGEYSTASDLWSIGIILYILMTGIPPLRIDLMCDYPKALEVLKVISDQGGFQFDAPPLPDFPLAQDLCIRLLQWDPKKRIQSCQQALKHPWLVDSFKYNPIGPIYKQILCNTDMKKILKRKDADKSIKEIEGTEEFDI
ncbi:kinase domain [Cryptosporidium sp. chipmunk genotype I]|uniref:kinase domain n=1 Tax=Cryptosporidium sp. chipmunk genotype I TaxID=1280935 RepID=UPI00351A1447|nr:kinase domain [Cryptosporidium sp. chipmunk genotype I]